MEDEVEVTTMTPEEWRQAIQNALDRVGLTREEVLRQGRSGKFSNVEVLKLWYLISGDEE